MTCSNICSEVLLRNCIKLRCILRWQNPPFLNSSRSMKLGWLWKCRQLENREICRTNKLYSFALAGCHMLISKTPAQEQFLREFPDAGELIDLNEPKTIADALGEAFEKRDRTPPKTTTCLATRGYRIELGEGVGGVGGVCSSILAA